jgi:ketosteroid isomerase-like protein
MSGAMINLSADVPITFPVGQKLAIPGLLVRLTVIALVFVLCGSGLHAGQPKSNKHENRHEIEQLEEAWRNAMIKADTTAMSALLADDYIAISASGTLQTRDQALANLRRIHITALNVSDRKLRFYGNTALVTSLADVQGTKSDGDISGSFRYTRVYVLDPQGNWKIVSFEASRIRQFGDHQ